MAVKRTYNLNKYADAFDRKYGPEIINDIRAVIHKDIVNGVRTAKNIDGTRTAELKPETVESKVKKRYIEPTLPRVGTGAMSGVFGSGGPFVSQRAKPGSLISILRTAAKAFYGIYQQAKRKWWGIAPRTEKDVDKVIRTKTVRMMKTAHVRGI